MPKSVGDRPSPEIVVIGGGLGGMITAAILGRARRRVLLLEREERLGGRLRSSAMAGGWVIDAGAYLWPDAYVSEALRRAGADGFTASEIPREKVLRLFVEGHSGRRLAFPYPLRQPSEKLLDASRASLGIEAASYERLSALWRRLAEMPDDHVEALRHVPLREGITRLGVDADLAGALQRNVMLYGTYDPGSASTAECIELCRRRLDRPQPVPMVPGANPGGGVAAMVRSLASAVDAAGVVVRVNAEATAIETSGDIVTGVSFTQRSEIRRCDASAVVVNVPIWQAIGLLPKDVVQDRLAASARAWSVVGGVIACAYGFRGMPRLRETGEPDDFPGWTRLLTRQGVGDEATEFGGGMVWTTLHSPANAPPGHHVLQAMRLSPRRDVDTPVRVAAVHAAFARMLGEIYLDIEDKLLWTRRWATHDGSEYMISAAPRPPVKAPSIQGLYFVGETTDVPAVQMDAAALSATRAAEMIIEIQAK